MKNKFDYQSVPYGFAHCFHSQCIHKEECLHHLAAINCTSQYPTLSIINPNRIPADTTDCPYFRKAQKYRVAWGIRHLLDNVPQCSPDEEPACRTLWQDHLLSLLPPGTRLVSKGTSIYPSGFQTIRNCRRTEIREIQRRIQLQRLKHPDSSALTKFIFEKHLSCYHAEGDILLIINRLKRERYP